MERMKDVLSRVRQWTLKMHAVLIDASAPIGYPVHVRDRSRLKKKVMSRSETIRCFPRSTMLKIHHVLR
jgi:hypothetical protein